MPFPPEFSSTLKYANRYDLDEIDSLPNIISTEEGFFSSPVPSLVIDDLIATGGTAEAAGKLIEISGGKVAGFIFVINLFDLPGNNLLKKKGYFTKSLIEFPGH